MFKRKIKSSAAGDAAPAPPAASAEPNPYVANAEAADDRYMNLAVDKHNWQVAWRLTVCLLAISMTFNGYYMTQSKFVPYVVAVDKIGHVIAVGPADKGEVDSKRVVRKEVLEWVENARAVIGDNFAQKQTIEKVYARVSSDSKAKKMLDEYFKDRKVFETAQTMTASADIQVALPTSPNTMQIEWTENWRNGEGKLVAVQKWKAQVTFEVTPQDTEEGIKRNASGVFVTDFSWSKQI